MKKAAITIGLSFAAHALVLWLLTWPRPPLSRAPTDVTLIDVAAPGAPGGGGAAGAPAPAPSPRSHSHPTHGHHALAPAPLAPAPATSAEAQPVVDVPPVDQELAMGDDSAGDSEPGDDSAGDGIGSGAGDLSRPRDLDRESCTRGLSYPWRASLLDKEGVVRLRVSLDAAGRVRSVTVLAKANYGFDEAAAEAVRKRCRFTAALDRNGKPTAFVIEDYRFYFRFADFQPTRQFSQWR